MDGGKYLGIDVELCHRYLTLAHCAVTISFKKANVLNVLTLNEMSAINLGVHIEKERRYLLFLSVGLAASSVSVSGGIGFVGLIAPHVARRLVGGNFKVLLPVTALLGALFVLAADTLGRSLFAPAEIPAGIVVAVIGAPYFLYLLKKS